MISCWSEPRSRRASAGRTLPPPKAKRRLRKLLLVGSSVLVLTGSAYFGWDYWTVGRFHVSTDDAYVKADNTTIAPKVSGYIGAVLVGDNEQVKAGQILARIDDRDFRVSVDQAKADVETAKAAIANKEAMLGAQESVIEAARATIVVDEANLAFAEQEDKRYSQARLDRLRECPECPAVRVPPRSGPRVGRTRHRVRRERDEAARRLEGRTRPGAGDARP